MLKLTGSVGASGANKVHDVALAQAILKIAHLKPPNQRVVYWSGPVDGKNSPALAGSIRSFQSDRQIRETGQIAISGPSLMALEKAVPNVLRGIRALPGYPLVFKSLGNAETRTKTGVNVARRKSHFPQPENAAFANFIENAARDFGLHMVVSNRSVTSDGRFAAEFRFPVMQFLDKNGKLQRAGRTPQDFAKAFADLVKTANKWEPLPGKPFGIRTVRSFDALKVGPVSIQEVRALTGISSKPNDPLVSKCVDACIKLAQRAPEWTKKDREEFKTLARTIITVNKQIGLALESAPCNEVQDRIEIETCNLEAAREGLGDLYRIFLREARFQNKQLREALESTWADTLGALIPIPDERAAKVGGVASLVTILADIKNVVTLDREVKRHFAQYAKNTQALRAEIARREGNQSLLLRRRKELGCPARRFGVKKDEFCPTRSDDQK